MTAKFCTTDRARRLAAALLAVILALLPLAAAGEADVEAAQAEAWVAEAEGCELNAEAENAAAASKHSLSVWSSMTYTVNVNDTLDLSFMAGGFKTLSSSKPKVADVVDKDAETGTALVVAKKAGETKLKAKLSNGKKVSLKLIVKDPYAPDKVRFSQGTEKMAVGQTLLLSPILLPATAKTSYTYTSAKKKVATVSEGGLVTAHRAGKSKITVRTSNGKKATVLIVVSEGVAPESVSLSDHVVSIGGTVQLIPALTPAGAQTGFSWSTSDKKVATVSDAGEVTGVSAGEATISVKTSNSLKASCKITVRDTPGNGAKYRALLVANDDFYWGDEAGWDRGSMNQSAASSLQSTLKKVTGPQGGKYAVTLKKNLSKEQLESAIAKAFADADDDDVSLFYFASHGDSLSSDSQAGALTMASVTETYPETAKLTELRDWLLAVNGKVIVLLDTCGSGAAVYKKGDAAANAEAARSACDRFDAAVARVFSEADPGVVEAAEGDVANTGELRKSNKFYVLCSSNYHEDSWAYSDLGKGGSYFTDWLTQGIGKSGSMPADQEYAGNNDGAVDLYELFKYISAVGDKYAITFDGAEFYQHVQVYPGETRYELFK